MNVIPMLCDSLKNDSNQNNFEKKIIGKKDFIYGSFLSIGL